MAALEGMRQCEHPGCQVYVVGGAKLCFWHAPPVRKIAEELDEDEGQATPYQVWVFDCPACGGQTMLGDSDPGTEEECADCGETVHLRI